MRLPRRIFDALRVGSRPICAGGFAWAAHRGLAPRMLASMTAEAAAARSDAAARCPPAPWCSPEALANPGWTPERIDYFDHTRFVAPQIAGGLDGDLVPGRWAVEVTRAVAPSYMTTVLERAQTFLRIQWDTGGQLGAPVEVVGSDPTPAAWVGTFDPYPLPHPGGAQAGTISAAWVVVALGDSMADDVVPLARISPVAGDPSQVVPACMRLVPDWADNRRGMHRSVDREQHVLSGSATLRMFCVIEATGPVGRIARIKVGGRLAGFRAQSGPWLSAIRAATVRN